MPFRIGEVYRYSNQNRTPGVPPKVVDGLPNFFYETYGGEGRSSIFFQKGIHNLAAVDLGDGTKRIPAIIISSSPHKAGTDITPWEDEFDPDHGRIRYYGDTGVMVTGLQSIDGNVYGFGEDGFLLTGWQEFDGNRYFLTESGIIAINEQILPAISSTIVFAPKK